MPFTVRSVRSNQNQHYDFNINDNTMNSFFHTGCCSVQQIKDSLVIFKRHFCFTAEKEDCPHCVKLTDSIQPNLKPAEQTFKK